MFASTVAGGTELPFSLFVLTSETHDRPNQDTTHLLVHSSVKEVFPKEFEGKSKLQEILISEGVQCVGDKAFKDCTKLERVSLPSTLERVGYRSFYWTSLITVELKHGFRSIGYAAFGYCRFLRKVQLPFTLEKIEDWAFSNCTALVDICLPKGLQSIGRLAFYGCTALTNISIPSTVDTIGGWCFQSCTSLSKVQLGASIKILEAGTFAQCHALSNLSVPMGVEVIANDCFCECIMLLSVELPEGLTQIDAKAFFGCQSLCAIVIPSSTIIIGQKAFGGCTSLLGVELCADHIQFGAEAFANCPSLVSIELSSAKDIPDDLFFGCPRLQVNDDDDKDENTDDLALLQDRFAELPVHEACYHSSSTSVEDLMASIHQQASSNDWAGPFGATPFHIIAASATQPIDMFQVLLDHIPFGVLSQKDCNGNTMMDYLLQNRLSTSILLIRMVLHKTLVDGMASWGNECWQASLRTLIESRSWGTAQKTKMQALQQVIQRLESYARVEMKSLLELTVWKSKLMDDDDSVSSMEPIDRRNCRLLCGANVVKANVLAYLWDENNVNPMTSVALSMFPYDVSWMSDCNHCHH
ncbi:unnamed protein product [Cylindrotheca closterium]|uniref:Uncharacterized protein n=1 Tax=Cylindrotheca closterium TaxID=2856 RepID=A0AAD2FNG4_9STRA|nr:unnamed protein product [Cylindrotheca closterium]